ncbi:BRO-N domain-containing protein [Phytopseudomonas punonensis]|nr:Bro-N domain-containing protein [Pseudomonas punonensis]
MLINDQPWFVAADVAASLDYGVPSAMTRHLDDDEKGVSTVHTLGGAQEMLVINESGLYSAILRSRKAEAKRFKKWVTAEVLPAIRKHGRYHDEQGKMATLIGETIGTDGFHMLGALIKGKVASMPAAKQRKATAKIWSQTHAAFGVRSAADIPASQLDSARNFIAAYALEGDWLPKDARPKILSREQRVLGYLDLNGVERWEDIAAGAYILTRREFIDSMLVHCDMPVTTDEMFEFAQLALANLNSRSNCMAAQLKAIRKRD